jgi:calpain-7
MEARLAELHVNESEYMPREFKLMATGRCSYSAEVFCLSWDAVCTKFETVELNWKSLAGLKTAEVHWYVLKSRWSNIEACSAGLGGNRYPPHQRTALCPLVRASGSCSLRLTFSAQNPRYRLSATTTEPGSEIWILLSQHITHKDRKGDAIALHIFEGDTVGSVLAPSRATYSGSYTDGLHVLVCGDCCWRIRTNPSRSVTAFCEK